MALTAVVGSHRCQYADPSCQTFHVVKTSSDIHVAAAAAIVIVFSLLSISMSSSTASTTSTTSTSTTTTTTSTVPETTTTTSTTLPEPQPREPKIESRSINTDALADGVTPEQATTVVISTITALVVPTPTNRKNRK